MLEAVQFLTSAIQKINNLKAKKEDVKSVSDLLSESSGKITRTCHFIEKIENLKKIEIKNKAQTQHKINTLELEIRKQGDIAFMLQEENQFLIQKLEEFETFKTKNEEMKNQLEDLQLTFGKERFDFAEKIKELEIKLKDTEEKNNHLTKRLGDLKEDMSMIDELNEKKVEELQQKLDGNTNYEDAIEQFKNLKKRDNENSQLIEELQNEKATQNLRIQELEGTLQQEQLHQKELLKEIEVLNKNIKELEEKFSKENIEGKAHIGLSKIDFVGGNNFAFSKVSIGKSYFRGPSMRKSRMPSMMPEVIPEDESVVLEKSQIMLAPPSKMEQRYSVRSTMRSRINSNFLILYFSS